MCFWIIQPCFIVPPSSLCFSLFVLQRIVFKLGGVFVTKPLFIWGWEKFSLCAVCGRDEVRGWGMLVAGRLGERGRDPGLGDGICWNSREMRPQIGKFLILFSKLCCCWVRVPEGLGWKIILVHRETFAQLWCHLVWAGEESCWVTYGLVWILLHCLAWATTGFYHSPHAGVFLLPRCSSFHICRKGQDEVRNYQFPSPTTLTLTRIWCSVFRFFQGIPADSFHQSSSSITHGLHGGTSLRGRGWRICRIEPHELTCRTGFKWQGHWTKTVKSSLQ